MKYTTIVADPPWPMPTGGPASKSGFAVAGGRPSTLPYKTMSLDDIGALPVASLAADDAHLYVWTVNAFLPETYSIVEKWGFRPSQILVWAKNPRGIGLGGTFTNTVEFVLFARRGSLPALKRFDSTWWRWPRGKHSEKPEAFLDLVEQVSPGPYLEMFARRQRLGWDTWGNEALPHVEIAS